MQDSDRGYGATQRGAARHDPTKETPPAPPACQRTDWHHGWQHILHHAGATTLHHR